MKHTPEPWFIGAVGIVGYSIESGGNDWVCDVPDEPDANRIVACVNACAGINPAAVPALVDALDALFAECVMIHRYGGEIDNTQAANAAVAQARATLALAKGGVS